MKFLVDTNVCVTFLRGKSALLRSRFVQYLPTDIVVCSIVRVELYHGAEKGGSPANQRLVDTFVAGFPTLPFDDRAAQVYGRIRHDLESRGLPIGAVDLFIAAIALANGVTLVTHNTSEFSRIPALSLEDWEKP